jgi:hypothetical protein
MARRRLEIDIETDCVNIAAAAGVPSSKLEKVKRSWPDRAFWIPGGRPWIVEFKRPGETPEPQQAERIEMLRELGYPVDVIDSIFAFREAFSCRLPAA